LLLVPVGYDNIETAAEGHLVSRTVVSHQQSLTFVSGYFLQRLCFVFTGVMAMLLLH
jgi:hypothetical protein